MLIHRCAILCYKYILLCHIEECCIKLYFKDRKDNIVIVDINVRKQLGLTVTRDRRGRDRMVGGRTTTCAISVYHH
jgi:hypothetical protein